MKNVFAAIIFLLSFPNRCHSDFLGIDLNQGIAQLLTDNNALQIAQQTGSSAADVAKAQAKVAQDTANLMSTARQPEHFNDPGDQIKVARALNTVHQPGPAFDAANQAVKLDPASSDAYVQRGSADYNMGHYRAAAADARRALGLDSWNDDAKTLLDAALAAEAQRAANANGASPPGAKTPPRQAQPYKGKDQSETGAGHSGGPAPEAERPGLGDRSQQDPFWPGRTAAQPIQAQTPAVQARAQSISYVNRAVESMRIGDLGASRDWAERALSRDPNNMQARLQLATLDLKERKFASARDRAGQATRLDSKNAEAHFDLARALEGQGKIKEALSEYETAAGLDPKNYGDEYANAKARARLLGEGGGSGANEVAPASDSGRDGGSGRGILPGRLARILSEAGLVLSVLLAILAIASKLRPKPEGAGLTLPRAGAYSAREALGAPSRPASEAGDPLAAASPVPPAFAAEELFEKRYSITRTLGQGGMGTVFEATDRELGRNVAVKKLRPEIQTDPRERERFISEARIVASLHHPNIVAIYDVLQGRFDTFLIFELVRGKNLADVIHAAPTGRLPFQEVSRILAAVSKALDHAHHRGIIHRDLKPSNIMIDEEGNIKVMDFGIARRAKESLDALSRRATQAGAPPTTQTIVGTPEYMSPEQERGRAVAESDFYALALCAYEMLTGRQPFEGSSMASIEARLARESGRIVPPRRWAPELPAGLDAFFQKALDPLPENRFHKALELSEALAKLAC